MFIKTKFFVSKSIFDYPILDIFFVHFEKVKILFIFRKHCFLNNKLKKELKDEAKLTRIKVFEKIEIKLAYKMKA